MTDLPQVFDKSDEPLFTAISRENAALQAAYAMAARTMPRFIGQVQSGEDALFSAKLRFRDPDESERLGEDRFAFIWLTVTRYEPEERLLCGTFFEVPAAFQKWHHVGQELLFEPEDVFDWMALRNGHLSGGFTLRIARAKLPEEKRAEYDRHIGVSTYEPLPE